MSAELIQLAKVTGIWTARFIVIVLFLTGAAVVIKASSWLAGVPVDPNLVWFILGMISNSLWSSVCGDDKEE